MEDHPVQLQKGGNEAALEPYSIASGPWHHSNTDLETAETTKDTHKSDEATTEVAYNPNLERVMPDGGHEDDITIDDEIAAANIAAGDGPKKRKKKSRSKRQRAAKVGTGFEDYYVDAPLTPAEHEQEKGLYHASLPFSQRIEAAVQRYAAKRNMDSKRKNVFDKYLIHGGIEAGPKMFTGGLDSHTLATRDAQDIALITATNFVPFEKADARNENYVVDFESCLKVFLSYNVPTTFDLISEEYVKSLVNVIRNFLNYLLHHDVCPEYQDQIHASKRLCDQGERELWAIAQNSLDLPGTFNKACSELYGGIFQGQWGSASAWLTEEETAGLSVGIPQALARQAFKMGLVANTSAEQFEKYETQSKAKSIHITSVEDVSMEVVKAIPSSPEVQSLYASRGILKPLGKLLTKTWHTPFAPMEDLTEAEEIALADTPKETQFYEFWIEDDILCNCFPGMKLDVTVTELSIGISYFDKIYGIYCSFFYISANQRMVDWRKPEGEGSWLPMRATEGEPLEDGEGENGLDSDSKTVFGDANQFTEERDKEEMGGSRLAQVGLKGSSGSDARV